MLEMGQAGESKMLAVAVIDAPSGRTLPWYSVCSETEKVKSDNKRSPTETKIIHEVLCQIPTRSRDRAYRKHQELLKDKKKQADRATV
jgi:hypothetical protein